MTRANNMSVDTEILPDDMTRYDAATFAGVSVTTIYKWIRHMGIMPAYRRSIGPKAHGVSYYRRKDIEKVMRGFSNSDHTHCNKVVSAEDYDRLRHELEAAKGEAEAANEELRKIAAVMVKHGAKVSSSHRLSLDELLTRLKREKS